MAGEKTKEVEWYVADFETTTEKFYSENGYTKVWLYAIANSEGEVVRYGFSIEDFIEYITENLKGSSIYFHNLKFDGSFLVDYLLSNGYTYQESFGDHRRCFSTLIGDMGEWYSMRVRFGRGCTITFLDSLKLLPYKVKKIAEDFDLPIRKGSIDYDIILDPSNITTETLDYVFNDVRIVALALSQIKQEGMVKNTTASCAYHAYTSLRHPQFLNQCFPDLGTDFLEEWREAYRGGRCQFNPIHQDKILHNVYRYDINSMYPYVMHDMPLPYGNPIPISEMGKYKFELYHIRISFELKENHMPTLLKKCGLFKNGDSYYIDTEDIEELWISSVDFTILKRHYDITHFEFLSGYGFMTSVLLFRDYIDYWYKRKSIDKGAKRSVDKFMLNCLYGKYGSNCKGSHKIPYMDEVTGIVHYSQSLPEDMTHYYLPIAIAVTSWAHLLIDDAITLVGYSNFVYCDTDSVHSLVKLPDYLVDQKQLGKFKLESVEVTSRYVRQKTYVVQDSDGSISITCAGMTEDMKDALILEHGTNIFNVFKVGLRVEGKLLPKHVPGGTILHATTFKIK